jgi:hypothetical protein
MGRTQGASRKWRNDGFATKELAFKQDDDDRHFFQSPFDQNVLTIRSVEQHWLE